MLGKCSNVRYIHIIIIFIIQQTSVDTYFINCILHISTKTWRRKVTIYNGEKISPGDLQYIKVLLKDGYILGMEKLRGKNSSTERGIIWA